MKSSPDVENISQDALTAVTAATELFVKDLTQKVYKLMPHKDMGITYNDVAALVNNEDSYGFLDDIIPRKTMGRDILSQLKNKNDIQDDEDLKSEAVGS
ncbi:CHRAC1 [Bugula neritina]|uniref:CHRAC1 n=1 Tax=Bugula neritina TaxID=10212 RepID=A0A7J7IYL9_BUGNE|nr:CHRAC1 [Bugula neritina]